MPRHASHPEAETNARCTEADARSTGLAWRGETMGRVDGVAPDTSCREPEVVFERPDARIRVPAGTTVLRAAQAAGVPLDAVCGGEGRCGRCRIIAAGALSATTPAERELIAEADRAAGVRLACRARVLGDVRVRMEPAGVRTASPRRAAVMPPSAAPRLGVAVDLGTTTVFASLVDLRSGAELAGGTVPNPQVAWGADVLARVGAAQAGQAGPLQRVVVGAVEALIVRLAAEAGAAPRLVTRIALAGNTAMRALLLAEDVSPLAEAPYAGAPVAPRILSAASLGMCELRAAVYALPGVSAFIGGDVIAGTLATRLASRTHPALLLDLGTNGELVLSAAGVLSAASAAAGPALEGGGIEMGMRAEPGAVERVTLRAGRLEVATVDGAAPRGICGSGLIDLAAALLDAGVLDATGRLLSGPAPLAARVRPHGDQLAFELDGPSPVLLTQRDVRQLQLAKGAVRAAIDLLLADRDLAAADVPEVIVAGGFGSGVSGVSLARIGMLPAEWARHITFAGNTSLAGAREALVSSGARARAQRLAASFETLALAGTSDFEQRFLAALDFPTPHPASR